MYIKMFTVMNEAEITIEICTFSASSAGAVSSIYLK